MGLCNPQSWATSLYSSQHIATPLKRDLNSSRLRFKEVLLMPSFASQVWSRKMHLVFADWLLTLATKWWFPGLRLRGATPWPGLGQLGQLGPLCTQRTIPKEEAVEFESCDLRIVNRNRIVLDGFQSWVLLMSLDPMDLIFSRAGMRAFLQPEEFQPWKWLLDPEPIASAGRQLPGRSLPPGGSCSVPL